MSYLTYYNLRREPFSNAPDRRFFFRNEHHERALARLQYVANNQRGFALCTGPIGHGKTTLARRLYDLLPPNKFHKALLVVIHSDITADWLLLKFAKLLGVTVPKKTKVELLGQIYMRLRHIDASGRKAVILIDEAQMLKDANLMEEFRGLLNIELKGRKLINFIFFGLPKIEDNLKLDEPLRQRVALRVILEPYSEEETRSYIHHRMQIAGGSETVFGGDVIRRIHNYAQGTPRLINTLCDNLLLEGYFAKKPILDIDMVDELAHTFQLMNEHDQAIADLAKNIHFGEEEKKEETGFSRADNTIDELINLLEK